MSYGAVGDGWMTLRMDEQAKSGLKEKLLARYDELCQSEQKATPEFCESIHRCYEAKKQALERNEPCAWLKKEFSDARFCDVSVDENAVQETVYIEASFDGKYYEEEIMGLLDTLSAWTVEGSFSFRGEDDGLWRLHFTGAEWAEQNGEIAYAESDVMTETQVRDYPPLVEDVGTFEALLSEVETRLKSDERPAPQRGRQLIAAFHDQDPDGVLMALTGWSLRSLGALAGIWQDTEGTTPS